MGGESLTIQEISSVTLLKLYEEAKEKGVEEDFIKILKAEIKKRGISLPEMEN